MNFAKLNPLHLISGPRFRFSALIFFVSYLFSAAAVCALAPIGSPEQYQLPADMSGVHFYLITVDVGDLVYDNFGHTALRVYDENSNTDTVYNWGEFDPSDGVVAFSYNFFKGIMNYRLATYAPAQLFANYRYQQRTLWQDKINLTNPQKEILYRRLLWNLQPENVVYPYQSFDNNCTTKVRDYLDEALSGKISAHYSGITETTYRDLIETHYASVSLINFSLDILLNSNIDRPISEWEDMFLPLSLRERLLRVDSDVAENGERKMLLSDPQVIMEFGPPMIETGGYQVASIVLLVPVFLLFLMLKKIPMSYYATHSQIGLKVSSVSFRLLGLLGLLAALFSGVFGALMLGGWFVSDHLELHHNVNLLIFWPTDLLGIVVSLRWLILCKPWPMTPNNAPFIHNYLLAHVIGMLIYAVIAALELSTQSISNVALYVLPGIFLLTLLIWLVGFEPAKPKNTFF